MNLNPEDTFVAFIQLHTGPAGFSGMSNVHRMPRLSTMFVIDREGDRAYNVDPVMYRNEHAAHVTHFSLWSTPTGALFRDRIGSGRLTSPHTIHRGDMIEFKPYSINCGG